jgi:orotidine-5'-phosphate decarboxylase
MGSDSLSPFLKDPTKGAFVLCKTSNPGSNELQTLPIVGKYYLSTLFIFFDLLCLP